LNLEVENGGAVSRGLKPSQILRIPIKIFKGENETEKSVTKKEGDIEGLKEVKCTVCFEGYK